MIKKPVSWLIRELQKIIEEGYDYVELSTENEYGNISQILIFEKP